MRVFIAGPYRSPNPLEVTRNIEQARNCAAELLRRGHTPYCPHTMTGYFERYYPDIPDYMYQDLHLQYLRLCEAIVLLPGWQHSQGTMVEKRESERLEQDRYIYPALPEAIHDAGTMARSSS